jgi:hypothetical protein
MSEKHLPIHWRDFTVEVDSGSLSTDLWAYLKSDKGEAVLTKMRELQSTVDRVSSKTGSPSAAASRPAAKSAVK